MFQSTAATIRYRRVAVNVGDQERAEKHTPKTAEEIQAAARELAKQYSDHAVAAILKMDVDAVRQMIGERPST